MGIACKIIHNHLGEIEIVQAPNGEQSKLYSDLVKHIGNGKQALDIWTLPYTIGFTKRSGDWQNNSSTLPLDINGEPLIKDVLNYAKFIRNKGKRLSNRDIADLANNLYSLPINSLEELYREIRNTFYPNGIFELTKKNLDNSILYTELEIIDIMSNPILQNSIKELVEKVETHFLAETGNKVDKLLNTYFFEESDLIVDRSSTIGLGKYTALNPFEINKKISNILGGVKDRDSFNTKVLSLPYSTIISRYQSDANFANKLFERYSKLKPINSYKQIDGELTKRTTNESAIVLKEVLKVDISNEVVKDNTELLAQLSNVLWEENIEEVKVILKEIETSLVDFNIDVIGLTDTVNFKSQEEVMNLLDSLSTFTEGASKQRVLTSDIDTLADILNTYFNRIPQEVIKYERVNNRNEGRTLISLTPTTDELNLFSKHSLVKTTEGYYQKVKVIEDVDLLYDTIYSLSLVDSNLLPKEAFYPTAFDSDNTFNEGKLKDVENKLPIIEDLKRYIGKKSFEYSGEFAAKDSDALRKLVIYKLLFKHPLSNQESINVGNELLKIESFKGDFDYLTTDFVSDFYNYILENKIEQTPLYKQVLRHFSINERGINLENNDLHTIQKIKLLSPSNSLFKALGQYSIITKENSLKDLTELKELPSIALNNKEAFRTMYINNNNALPQFKGNYDQDGDLLITNNGVDSFIRTSEGIFEKIQNYGNVSFYRKLPSFRNSLFNNYSLKPKIDENISINKYTKYINKLEGNTVNVNKLYNNKELSEINNKIDECN